MKPLLVLLLLLSLGACAKEDHEPSFFGSEVNQIGEELSGIYHGTETSEPEIIDGKFVESRDFYYAGSGAVQENKRFFIEENGCITSDYMVAIVVTLSDDEYALEIGSNCYDRSQQGGIVIIQDSEIPILNDETLEIFDYVKVYYKFPIDFTPTSYVDYLNYATEIVITGEKMDPQAG